MEKSDAGLREVAVGKNDSGGGAGAERLNTRGEILSCAFDLTYGNRNKDYGEPVENFRETGEILQAIASVPLMSPDEVVLLSHIATKLARIRHSPMHQDSYVDLINYVAILWEVRVHQARKRGE